jgi:uncharacterized cupredoxin-like copper-binding protein
MRKLTALALLAVFILSGLALAACGSKASGPTVVKVTLTEFKVAMDKNTIPAGPVTFQIQNDGKETHEVVLEPAGVNDEPFEANGKASEAEDIPAGGTATLDWTIDKAGQYQLACHINENNEDHYASGMVTTFDVTAP